MLKDTYLEKIIDNGILASVKTVGDVKKLLKLSNKQFKELWESRTEYDDSQDEEFLRHDDETEFQMLFHYQDYFEDGDWALLSLHFKNRDMKKDVKIEEWKVKQAVINLCVCM